MFDAAAAERAVLARMLLDAGFRARMAEALVPPMFWERPCRLLFQAVAALPENCAGAEMAHLIAAGVDGWDASSLADLLDAPGAETSVGAERIARTIASRPAVEAPPPGDADCPDAAVEAWRERLIMVMGKDGPRVRACAPNALVFAEHHPELRGRVGLDVWRQQLTWTEAPPWADATRDVRDEDADEMALWLAHTEGVVLTQEACWRALRAVAVAHPVDRVREWLDGLQWDGEHRLAYWLHDYAGADDSDYVRAVSHAWCLSAVARVYRPGCQVDHMLVLEGPQGAGKTNSLRTLAGDHLHAEITLAVTRDGVMDLHGPWIVEWAELSGLSRAEIESVKALISRRVDRIRLPYARTVAELPRRCVMAATTNEEGWASDTTGNRRYWPVRVGACDTEALARVREQIWAEARVAYEAGGQWWLDQGEALLAAQEQAARVPEDPWASEIAAMVEGRYKGDQWLSSGSLLEALGVVGGAQTTAAARRLAVQMRALGWTYERRRTGPGRLRVWARPGPRRTASESGPEQEVGGPDAEIVALVR